MGLVLFKRKFIHYFHCDNYMDPQTKAKTPKWELGVGGCLSHLQWVISFQYVGLKIYSKKEVHDIATYMAMQNAGVGRYLLASLPFPGIWLND
ncbi:hypothetical protein GDO81_016010 [Engystomops pustulosus]|uniref:Uncharacterized protein n=1 Tax=Engystomops pustulosus TaxID=76066 RepID=A0AAV7AP34_ENGPU|nr:hypothetical protein GDO81_016010 [Engystomops pustulosus]